MDFSDAFERYDAREAKCFLKMGFKKNGGLLSLEKPLEDTGLVARVSVDAASRSLTAEAFDAASRERYVLVDVPSSRGKFVAQIRQSLSDLARQTIERCFVDKSLRAKVEKLIARKYGAPPERPWAEYPGYSVFRCPNKKWFAIIMDIPLKKLFGASGQIVDVLNVKLPPGLVAGAVDMSNIFPAYHMNKKHWVSAVLRRELPMEKIEWLLSESFRCVCPKGK